MKKGKIMEHNYKSSDIEFPLQKIEHRDMRREVETSFIEYSMSVITARALPDVRATVSLYLKLYHY